MLANLAFLLDIRGFVGNKKPFPVLHLLDGMNKSLRGRSKYLTNITSTPKVLSLEYILQSRFEPRPETCMLILIICVLWQRV